MKRMKTFFALMLLTLMTALTVPAQADVTFQNPYVYSSVNFYSQGNSASITVGETAGLYLDQRWGSPVRWTSSNNAIARVSENGVVKGMKPGTATLSVVSNAGWECKCTLTVKPIVLDEKSFTIPVGGRRTITTRRIPIQASWKSSKKKVATVTKKGVIKAVSPGSATISAKLGGKTYKVKVKVKKKFFDSYKLDSTIFYVAPNEKVQIKANGKKCKAKWKSDNTRVATVNKNGQITGRSPGVCNVTAEADGGYYVCKVYVDKADPYLFMPYENSGSLHNTFKYDSSTDTYETSVDLRPHNMLLYYSYDHYTDHTRRYGDDKPLIMKVTEWRSSDPSVISIKKKSDTMATAYCYKSGTAVITAVTKGKSYQFKVKVENSVGDTAALLQTVCREAGISQAMKPQYKLFLLAKWECDYFEYDHDPNNTMTAHSYLKAYQTGKAVCQAYSDMFHFMATGLGIHTERVLRMSNNIAESHQWNQVEIDGEWYNVDVCWMDTGTGTPDMYWFLTTRPSFQVKNMYETTSKRFEGCTWQDWNNGNWQYR